MTGAPVVEPVTIGGHPPMCHAPSLAQLADGTLVCVWYAASYEGAADSGLWLARRPPGGSWSPPRPLPSYAGLPAGNPVLYRAAGDNRLWCYFVALQGDWWTEATVCRMASDDGGERWQPAQVVDPRLGLMTKNPPLAVGSALLLPVYQERQWAPLVLYSADGGASWQLVGETTARGRAIQPALACRRDGTLVMFCRSNTGRVLRSVSVNGGRSWTASQPTGLANPNSAVHVLAHTAGPWLMAGNPAADGRRSLALALSPDEGETWSAPAVIAEDVGEVSYPMLLEDSEGTIHLVYTRARAAIMHARFSLEWASWASRHAAAGPDSRPPSPNARKEQ